jgi:hypothetical protein
MKKSPKSIATQRVLNAAMKWHYWLTQAAPGADYHAYCKAAKRLEKACARLKKVSK